MIKKKTYYKQFYTSDLSKSRPRSDTSSSLMKYNKGVHHLPVSFFQGIAL